RAAKPEASTFRIFLHWINFLITNKTTAKMKRGNSIQKYINVSKVAILLTFFVVFSASAQDKKAKELLDQVASKVKSYDNITIDFKYSLTNLKENINRESKGNVVLSGNRYVLNFMGVTKIFDGKKTYTISPEDEEITISSIDEKDENAITPNKMLTFFNHGYKYTWDIL